MAAPPDPDVEAAIAAAQAASRAGQSTDPDVEAAIKAAQSSPQATGAGAGTVPVPAGNNMSPGQRYAIMGGQAMAEGLTNALGTMGNIREINGPVNDRIPSWAAGLMPPLAQAMRIAPTSAQLQKTVSGLGPVLPGSIPEAVPSTPLEQYAATAVGSLPSAAIGMMTGLGPLSAIGSSVSGAIAGKAVKDATGSPTAGFIAGLLAGAPFATANAAKTLGSIASNLHPAEDLEDIGHSLQDFARQWRATTGPQRMASQYDELDKMVHPLNDVDPQNFGQTISQLAGSAGNWQDIKDFFSKTGIKTLTGLANSPKVSNAEGVLLPTTIDAAKQVRSSIGDAMGNPTIVKDMKRDDLETLYGALSEDMRNAYYKAGGQLPNGAFDPWKAQAAADAWDATNKMAKSTIDTRDNFISRIIASKESSLADPKPGDIGFDFLGEGKYGSQDYNVIKNEVASDPALPDPRKAIAAVAIKNAIAKFDPSVEPKPPGINWTQMQPDAKKALIDDPALADYVDHLIEQAKAPQGGVLANALKNASHNGAAGWTGAALGHVIAPQVPAWLVAGLTAGTYSLGNQLTRQVMKNPAILRAPLVGGIAGGQTGDGGQ